MNYFVLDITKLYTTMRHNFHVDVNANGGTYFHTAISIV